MLHYVLPQPPREGVRFVACVGVIVGYNNRMRVFSVFERGGPMTPEQKALDILNRTGESSLLEVTRLIVNHDLAVGLWLEYFETREGSDEEAKVLTRAALMQNYWKPVTF